MKYIDDNGRISPVTLISKVKLAAFFIDDFLLTMHCLIILGMMHFFAVDFGLKLVQGKNNKKIPIKNITELIPVFNH